MSKKTFNIEKDMGEILDEIQRRSDVEFEDSADTASTGSSETGSEEDEEELVSVPVYHDEEERNGIPPGPSVHSGSGKESPLLLSDDPVEGGDYVPPRRISAKRPRPTSSSSSSPEPESARMGHGRGHGKTRGRGRGRGRQATKHLVAAEDGEQWHTKEEPDVVPQPPKFEPKHPPGPRIDPKATWSPLALFKLFFSSRVIQDIINNTNENAARRLTGGKRYKWSPLSVDMFLVFLSIVIFSGLVRPHERADLWRRRFPYNFPYPRSSMTRDQFEAIFWSLHLSNIAEDDENEKKKGTPQYDRLFKIRPLYDQIVNSCNSLFQPSQNITIDEQMVASKARIGFRQYIKDKPTKFGYKLFVLADSKTGYTFNFFVYQGKEKESNVSRRQNEDGLSVSSVMNLMNFDLLGKGYRLYVDNFYTSAHLFQKLADNNTAACGTVRTNRQGFPRTTKNDLPLKPERGDMRWIRRDNLLFVRWMDTKVVNMCSTIHSAYSGASALRRVKGADGKWQRRAVDIPDACKEYNINMGGVDLSDALIQYYTVLNKTMRWYKTFFYHFIDIAIVNSFILYKSITRSQPVMSHKQFREALMQELVSQAEALVIDSAPSKSLTTTCMPLYRGESGASERRKCVLCAMKEKRKAKEIHNYKPQYMKTPVYCSKCNISLCLVPGRNCFVEYHGFSL